MGPFLFIFSVFRIVAIFRKGCSFGGAWRSKTRQRGWLAGIKLPTFDRISDCMELEFYGRLNGISFGKREGCRRAEWGCIFRPFRRWLIRLRGKISIRNDIGGSEYARQARVPIILPPIRLHTALCCSKLPQFRICISKYSILAS